MSLLRTELAGLHLPNPTMLASGILGLSVETLLRVAESGAGAVVTKSVGSLPRVGFPNPTVVEVDCGLLNAMGLPNPGIRKFGEEIGKMKKRLDVPIIVSVYGYSPEEYSEVAAEAAASGADAIELNLSCPHVKKTGSEIGCDPKLASEVVAKVKENVGKPVFAKLSPNVSDIVGVSKAVAEAGVDALTAINTVKAMAIDIETSKPVLGNAVGGLSGKAIKPVAVRSVYEISLNTDVPVIGCGGIYTWRDAAEFILAGASAVQVGTALASESLNVFSSITAGLESYIRRKGFRSVNEIVGLSHRC